jgi:hypothetical protein
MKMANLLSIAVKKFISPQSGLYRKLQLVWYRLYLEVRKIKFTKLKFGVHLTEHCNLNCAYCDAFAPLAKENFYPIETFKRDCERLAQLTGGRILEIGLAGGEPLLHPDITEFFNVARSNFSKSGGGGGIRVTTNGILLVKQPETFWQSCKNNDIEISITKYPIKLNIDKICETAKTYGVKLSYMFDTDKLEKTMYKLPYDLEGAQNIKKSFGLCFSAIECITLKNGKLSTCKEPAQIHLFNDYFGKNLQVSEDDFIDIYKAKSIGEILDFLRKPIPFCRYCNWIASQTRLEWHVSKKEISEWT